MPCEILTDPNAVLLTLEHEGKTFQSQIDLVGATVTSWKINNKELIFVSSKAQRDGSKAIRGGIPIVFPQFGKVEEPNPASRLPQHGFARSLRWKFDSSKISEASEMISATFTLTDNDLQSQAPEMSSLWSYAFNLTYQVTLGTSFLSTSMSVALSDLTLKVPITPLLHSYLIVDDVSNTWVTGLDSLEYIDKVEPSSSNKQETQSKVTISDEVDRIYINAAQDKTVCLYPGESAGYHLEFESINLSDVVLWNPWIAKAQSMSDMGDLDYKKFVCVELGKIQEPFFSSDFTYGQKIKYVKD